MTEIVLGIGICAGWLLWMYVKTPRHEVDYRVEDEKEMENDR